VIKTSSPPDKKVKRGKDWIVIKTSSPPGKKVKRGKGLDCDKNFISPR
jgi:hypothetical protein